MFVHHPRLALLAAVAAIFTLTVSPHAARADNGSSRKSDDQKDQPDKVDMSEVPADESAEQADLASLPDGFELLQTRHYSILYNTSNKDAKAFGQAIERTYRSGMKYAANLGVAVKPPDSKLIIYYFDEHADYALHSVKLGRGKTDENTPGLYLTDLNRSMFYNYQNHSEIKRYRVQAERRIEGLKAQLKGKVSPEQRRKVGEQIRDEQAKINRTVVVGTRVSEQIVQHEVSHQVLWNIGFHNSKSFEANPRWLVEGTAQMFEPVSDGKSANVGAVNKGRLEEYRSLVNSGKLLPIRELVGSPMFFHSADIQLAYPQSWALVHFLNRSRRDELRDYVGAINRRKRGYTSTPERELKLFEKHFGELDEGWVKRWTNWMKDVR